MAKYDLPATINYILAATGASQIYYVGHSQGTEIAFAGFGMDWNNADKVKTFFAFAPVTHLGNLKSPIARAIIPFVDPLEVFIDILLSVSSTYVWLFYNYFTSFFLPFQPCPIPFNSFVVAT